MNDTLAWLYAAEQPTGGISAWAGMGGEYHKSYIEVSGYLIPSMLRAGARDLVIRTANWLVTMQNPDGSYNGLDNVPRPFDTAAVMEGLLEAYKETKTAKYYQAYTNARVWMSNQVSPDGYLYNNPNSRVPEIYNLRASAIIGNKGEMNYWKNKGLLNDHARTHYLAYALEGALNFGENDFAMPYLEKLYAKHDGLMPFYVDKQCNETNTGQDVCSTIQMAILFHRVGLDVTKYVDEIKKYIHPSGGVPQSPTDRREIAWAAKYWLDLQEVLK